MLHLAGSQGLELKCGLRLVECVKYEMDVMLERLPRSVCAVLINSDILITNYGVKQSQFTKPTSEPRASDPEKSNEVFDRAIRG